MFSPANPFNQNSITYEDAIAWLQEQPGGQEFIDTWGAGVVGRLMSELSMSQLGQIPGSAERKRLYGHV